MKNAVIAPGTYCLAQFMASVPFNFIAALTFQSIFHWLTNINPDGEVFIYAVLITCGHLLLMEVSEGDLLFDNISNKVNVSNSFYDNNGINLIH